MKTWFLILLHSAALLGAADAGHNLFRVRSARDVHGEVRRLGEAAQTRAVVFIVLGPECPISQRYVPEMNRIAAECRTNGVEFFGIAAGHSMTRAEAADFVKEYAIQFPVLFDDGLALARWLRPTHMPEAFLLKPDGDRMYRGRIDNWFESPGKARAVVQHHELREAIRAVLAGRLPSKTYAPPVGCYFEDWGTKPPGR